MIVSIVPARILDLRRKNLRSKIGSGSIKFLQRWLNFGASLRITIQTQIITPCLYENFYLSDSVEYGCRRLILSTTYDSISAFKYTVSTKYCFQDPYDINSTNEGPSSFQVCFILLLKEIFEQILFFFAMSVWSYMVCFEDTNR